MLRRLGLALLVVGVIAFAVATSAGGGRSESIQISWVMLGPGAAGAPASDIVLPNCADVPAGVWVRGTGTWTLFDEAGAKGSIQSMAHGSATDSAGNSYRWNYHQSIQPIGDGHSRVVDDFVVSGSGPAAGIHSHFIAVIDGTSLEETQTFELLHLLGDPFNCDPL